MFCGSRLCLIWLLVYTAVVLDSRGVAGQGLLHKQQRKQQPVQNKQAASDAQASDLVAAAQYQQIYKKHRKDRCQQTQGILCGSAAAAKLEQRQQVLQLAAAPAAYDVRSWPFPVKPRLNPAFDQQECGMCVAAAVAAAAEAAVASVLKVPAPALNLSRSYLHFCSLGGKERSCSSGWYLQSAMQVLTLEPVPSAACAANQVGGRSGGPKAMQQHSSATCPRQLSGCPKTIPELKGVFRWRQLKGIWEVQDHIRQYGSVLTHMQLYYTSKGRIHLRDDFYRSRPASTPYSLEGLPANKTGLRVDGHAVLLVGFDNQRKLWQVQSSYGPRFAENGTYKHPYGVSGIAPASQLYGIEYLPFDQQLQQPKLQTKPSARPGCFVYTAQKGDFPLLVSRHYFGTDLTTFLRDNKQVIADIGQPLRPGLQLTVCGGTTPAAAAAAGLLGGPASNGKNALLLALDKDRPKAVGSFPNKCPLTAQQPWSPAMMKLLQSLRAFDGRSAFLAYGPISQLCVWQLQLGWILALQVFHGSQTSSTAVIHGDTSTPGNSAKRQCVALKPGEHIVKLSVVSGVLVHGLQLHTSKGRVLVLGAMSPGAGDLAVAVSKQVFAAPASGCYLASISGWVGCWFLNPATGWFQHITGLQLDWAAAPTGG